MKKRHIVPVLGSLGAFGVCWALIHFWMAPWYSYLMEVSLKTAYISLMTLLVAYTIVRIIDILRDKDEITKMIDEWHED